MRSSKYIGLGMSAALTGLALGGILLACRGILLSPETTQSLLTFNHSNFFVCGSRAPGQPAEPVCARPPCCTPRTSAPPGTS